MPIASLNESLCFEEDSCIARHLQRVQGHHPLVQKRSENYCCWTFLIRQLYIFDQFDIVLAGFCLKLLLTLEPVALSKWHHTPLGESYSAQGAMSPYLPPSLLIHFPLRG